jgi:hypothetical protein
MFLSMKIIQTKHKKTQPSSMWSVCSGEMWSDYPALATHSSCLQKERCLPALSNVNYNACLKEIGDMSGIPKDKPLVTHLARKTFACTILSMQAFRLPWTVMQQ